MNQKEIEQAEEVTKSIMRGDPPTELEAVFPSGASAEPEGDAARKLLRKIVEPFATLVGRHCGNSEGTPCDDMRPKYVCKYHRLVQEIREELSKP